MLEAHQFTAGGEQAQLHGLGQGEARSLGGGQGSEGHPVELAIGGEKPLAAAAELGQQGLENLVAQLGPDCISIGESIRRSLQTFLDRGINRSCWP